MRKAQIVSFLFVLVFILIAGVVGVNQANAVVCPAGFVCTPVSQTTVACPAGYICEPVKSTPTVITGLTYKKEDGSELKWCYSLTKNLGELDGAPGYESTGADVVALQSQLIGLGYDIPSVSSGGSARGQFDEDTKKAVMKYQASKGIPSTGYVGPLTRASLNSLCSNSASTIQTWIPSAEPYISVINPNGNEKINLGQKVKITWKSNKIDKIEAIQIRDVNEGRQSALQAYTIASNISNAGSYEWIVPYDLFAQKNLFSDSTRIGGRNFKIYVKGYCSTCSTVGTTFSEAGVYSATDMSDESFYITISPGTSPSPTPYFTPVAGEKPVISYVKPSSNTEGRIIGIGHEIYPNDVIDVVGTKLIGKGGTDIFINNRVCNAISRTYDKITCYVPLEGIVEGNTYELYAKTDDGIKSNVVYVTVKNRILTQTPAQPSISFTYPRYAETWYLGETKNVSWTYNNFDSSVSGEKYVELQLVPLDGRSPIVLGTYTAPYGYQPLTIYTKTSTGRDAWLPGEYKLKLVCRSSNVNGFKNCRADAAGYITVKAPTPTPTSSPVSVNPSNDLNAAIWSAVEEYNRGR